MVIYKKRLRTLIIGMLFLCGLATYYIIATLPVLKELWLVAKGKIAVTDKKMELFAVSFFAYTLLFLFSVLGIRFYFSNIYPFLLDNRNGYKIAIPFTITKMEYFPTTGQYFIGCDDPRYPFHEVDQATYSQYNIGDTTYLYQAPLSKYYFEKDGKFTL